MIIHENTLSDVFILIFTFWVITERDLKHENMRNNRTTILKFPHFLLDGRTLMTRLYLILQIWLEIPDQLTTTQTVYIFIFITQNRNRIHSIVTTIEACIIMCYNLTNLNLENSAVVLSLIMVLLTVPRVTHRKYGVQPTLNNKFTTFLAFS